MHAHRASATATGAVLLMASLSACTVNGPLPPPVVITSNKPVGMSQRERGYIECATALIRAHPSTSRFRLQHGYQSKVLEDGDARLFRIAAFVDDERGTRTRVAFECTTERNHRSKVLSLMQLSSYPFDN